MFRLFQEYFNEGGWSKTQRNITFEPIETDEILVNVTLSNNKAITLQFDIVGYRGNNFKQQCHCVCMENILKAVTEFLSHKMHNYILPTT